MRRVHPLLRQPDAAGAARPDHAGCGDDLQVVATYQGLDGNNNQFWTFSWASACGKTIYARFTCVQSCIQQGGGGPDCQCLGLGLSCDNVLFTICSALSLSCSCPPGFFYSILGCGPANSGFGDPCSSCTWSFTITP